MLSQPHGKSDPWTLGGDIDQPPHVHSIGFTWEGQGLTSNFWRARLFPGPLGELPFAEEYLLFFPVGFKGNL